MSCVSISFLGLNRVTTLALWKLILLLNIINFRFLLMRHITSTARLRIFDWLLFLLLFLNFILWRNLSIEAQICLNLYYLFFLTFFCNYNIKSAVFWALTSFWAIILLFILFSILYLLVLTIFFTCLSMIWIEEILPLLSPSVCFICKWNPMFWGTLSCICFRLPLFIEV